MVFISTTFVDLILYFLLITVKNSLHRIKMRFLFTDVNFDITKGMGLSMLNGGPLQVWMEPSSTGRKTKAIKFFHTGGDPQNKRSRGEAGEG